MSDSLTEGYKDSPEYDARQRRFYARQKRKAALIKAIRKKYPEVLELLEEYYEESDD